MNAFAQPPIRVGVSSCLLGAPVRFDGGHKKDPFLVAELGQHVEWVPVCPELEVGMGVPREAVRLVRPSVGPKVGGLRMVGVQSGRDWTDAMHSYSRERVAALERLELSGYILKSKSPSCGMERVKVYGPKGTAVKEGSGLYATALIERFPLLPVEEEGRLNDPVLRENFIERVFCYHRWLLFRKERFTVGRLVELHRRHKFLILAHSDAHLRRLGRIVAGAKGRPADHVTAEYARAFFEALEKKPTVRTHVNVLQHILGFFKEKLDAGDRKELLDSIESYRRGRVPRLVPQTLILHHLRRCGIPYIEDQYYLSPHPKELVLRFHV
jgi:uncharacterized protein YbbK (DUF523 family)/uncharacterized protein YbgA (DUF1722 family)